MVTHSLKIKGASNITTVNTILCISFHLMLSYRMKRCSPAAGGWKIVSVSKTVVAGMRSSWQLMTISRETHIANISGQ